MRRRWSDRNAGWVHRSRQHGPKDGRQPACERGGPYRLHPHPEQGRVDGCARGEGRFITGGAHPVASASFSPASGTLKRQGTSSSGRDRRARCGGGVDGQLGRQHPPRTQRPYQPRAREFEDSASPLRNLTKDLRIIAEMLESLGLVLPVGETGEAGYGGGDSAAAAVTVERRNRAERRPPGALTCRRGPFSRSEWAASTFGGSPRAGRGLPVPPRNPGSPGSTRRCTGS